MAGLSDMGIGLAEVHFRATFFSTRKIRRRMSRMIIPKAM